MLSKIVRNGRSLLFKIFVSLSLIHKFLRHHFNIIYRQITIFRLHKERKNQYSLFGTNFQIIIPNTYLEGG